MISCRAIHRIARAAIVLLAPFLAAAQNVAPQAAAPGTWLPLERDGLHDPALPALRLLQQPAAALSQLPQDTAGNMVRWVRALQEGKITPRTNIRPETKIQVLDQDILLDLNGSMPVVRFPHRQHTEWLDCSNCHDHIFKRKTGATKISMLSILQGEQCGLCHGAVSFPLTECSRCHSVTHAQAREELKARSGK
jgi:c(7)-type cytochrome triheme protein